MSGSFKGADLFALDRVEFETSGADEDATESALAAFSPLVPGEQGYARTGGAERSQNARQTLLWRKVRPLSELHGGVEHVAGYPGKQPRRHVPLTGNRPQRPESKHNVARSVGPQSDSYGRLVCLVAQ
jgi:hypothetical protein